MGHEQIGVVVRWLRAEHDKRIARVGHVMSGGGREYDIGRATAYAHAAEMIESGKYVALLATRQEPNQ